MINFTMLKVDTNNNKIFNDIMMSNNKMKLLPASHYKSYPWNDFRFFCHTYARYGIVTQELIDILKIYIKDKNAIEIGAGCGDLGYHLGIPMTDSKIQDDPLIKKVYEYMGQPTINYPEDVEKIEAISAIKKYKPQVVIASWVTAFGYPGKDDFGCNECGVKENEILNMVDTYILYGNSSVHHDKPIMKHLHTVIDHPGFISRSSSKDMNKLFIWHTNEM